MNNDQLREQLENLHTELHKTDNVDPQQRELLRSLGNDIHEVLNREDNEEHHYRNLSERFKNAVSELETSHPQIALRLRGAIESLSFLGV